MAVEFMPIDVRVLSHPKMVRALKAGGPAVLWTWLGILAWTHEHDGDWLPKDCIGVPCGPDSPRTRLASVAHLVSTGLLDESDAGYRPHDFALWEASSESAGRRRYERERKKAMRKGHSHHSVEAKCPGHVRDNVPDTSAAMSPRARESDQIRSEEIRSDPPSPPVGGTTPEVHELVLTPDTPAPADPVRQVFDHWASVVWAKASTREAKFSEERQRVIRARLRSFTVEELCEALSRAAQSDYHLGKNDAGKFYGDVDNLLGSGGKVDKWLASKGPQQQSRRLTGIAALPPIEDDE